MTRRPLILGLTALALCAACMRAQDAKPAPTSAQVVLTMLGPITYPQIAKTAHIEGDVGIDLEVKQDGTVDSALAVSGPGLLRREATQTAQMSHFECRNCDAGVTPTHLQFTFKLVDNPGPSNCGGTPRPTGYPAGQSFPVISVTGEHVNITDMAALCIADGSVIRRRDRSWKCLYLWRCGRK